MVDKRELKPCPKCKSIYVYSDFGTKIAENGLLDIEYEVYCNGCDLSLKSMDPEIVKLAWNGIPREESK